MRCCFITLLFIGLQINVSAQNNHSVKQDSVLKTTDLKGTQWEEWNMLDTTWIKHMFPSCLLENHLELNCRKCVTAYITVQMKIDSKGKLVSHKLIESNICGKDASEKLINCFLDFFYFIEFPNELRNIIFEVKLGNSLKC